VDVEHPQGQQAIVATPTAILHQAPGENFPAVTGHCVITERPGVLIRSHTSLQLMRHQELLANASPARSFIRRGEQYMRWWV
jgi:hypothetical protein